VQINEDIHKVNQNLLVNGTSCSVRPLKLKSNLSNDINHAFSFSLLTCYLKFCEDLVKSKPLTELVFVRGNKYCFSCTLRVHRLLTSCCVAFTGSLKTGNLL